MSKDGQKAISFETFEGLSLLEQAQLIEDAAHWFQELHSEIAWSGFGHLKALSFDLRTMVEQLRFDPIDGDIVG